VFLVLAANFLVVRGFCCGEYFGLVFWVCVVLKCNFGGKIPVVFFVFVL
jgi:hypothetical protein